MSNGEKRPLHVGQFVAKQASNLLAVAGCTLLVAGSIRRQMGMVGDIELVACGDVRALWANMDALLKAGTVQKALYGAGATRWGDKYRGMAWKGWKVEIFAAPAEHLGYIYWLRTGPGDGNQYVMQRLMQVGAKYRAVEGMWRDGDTIIPTPNEETLFQDVLNMPYLAPVERTLRAYQQAMTRPGWQPGNAAVTIKPLQRSLFD